MPGYLSLYLFVFIIFSPIKPANAACINQVKNSKNPKPKRFIKGYSTGIPKVDAIASFLIVTVASSEYTRGKMRFSNIAKNQE